MAESRHVYPTAREHITTGHDCWCRPTVQEICPECGDEAPEDTWAACSYRGSSDCWRCGGEGWVACEDPDRYDGAAGLLIIHNDA